MKKWYTQSLGGGGGSSADAFEAMDADSGNDTIDLSVGNNVYSMPKTLFKNVGTNDKKNNANKGYMAALYAAYQISTGTNPYEAAKEAMAAAGPDTSVSPTQTATHTVPVNDMYGKLVGYKTPEGANTVNTITSKAQINKYIVDTLLKDWVEGQGGDYNVQTNYDPDNLNELHDNSKSFQSGISTALNVGAVEVNGQEYSDWYKRQPQAQEGYNADYGLPIAKDAGGNWIYQDDAGTYLNGSGNEIIDFTGATSLEDAPIVFDEASGGLVDPATGNPVTADKPGGAPLQPIDNAYNKYYEDLFSQQEGTLGKQILDSNTSLYQKEAANAQVLANTGVQAQAMQQAQGIKQITDQVRSERLAQLRGGMSEAQLADRELSMLMGSVNQFSNQGQMASQEAMAAQLGKSTAREMAFNDYITQSTALGQNAAANYASQAGDLVSQAAAYQARMRAEGKTVTFDDALSFVSNPTA